MRSALLARRRRLRIRGVTALEFAIVSPLVFLVIFFALEMGISMWADATLEVAAARVTRLGQIGIPADQTCKDAVIKILEDTMGGWVPEKTALYADVRVYEPGELNEVDLNDADYVPICDAGGRGDMVIYRLGFERPSFTGIMSWLDIPVLRFARTVIIQNEP
ncbi:pilus assembly protein [Alcaligenaceae bacterium CGII-47]|nr:pilus assembly protein [Alcaligenaceae bacterium CGII-47]